MFTVALVGADGAGKTSIARFIVDEAPLDAVYLYLGENPDSAPLTTALARLVWWQRRLRGARPASGPPPVERQLRAPTRAGRLLGKVSAAAQLAVLVSEELSRQRLARRHVRAGTVVVCDRDFFADYRAHDVIGDQRSLAQRAHGIVLRRLYRRPDLTIVLDAPADLLFARKPEGAPDALEARRQEYLALATDEPGTVLVDASRPLEDVARDALAAIAAHGRWRQSAGR